MRNVINDMIVKLIRWNDFLKFRSYCVMMISTLMMTQISCAQDYQEDYSSLIAIADHEFHTEIADTLPKMRKGMMFRPNMAANQAMIFIYPKAQRMTFWMKNTLIPLDMLFFNQRGQLLEIKNQVPPCKTAQCPTYTSVHDDIYYVVELKGGVAAALNIQVGAKLKGCGI